MQLLINASVCVQTMHDLENPQGAYFLEADDATSM